MCPARPEAGPAAANAGRTTDVLVQHHTRYRFDRPAALGPHEIRLRPVPGHRAVVRDYSLTVRPARHTLRWHFDFAGNYVARVLFAEPSPILEIDVGLTADLTPFNAFDFLVDPLAERLPVRYPEAARRDLAPFLEPVERGERLVAWLRELDSRGGTTVDFLVAVNQRLQREIAYLTRLEHGVQSCEETLARRSGSCRDSSWLLVQVLRHLGVAARYVSGYLIQLAGAPDGPKSDTVDLHAWAEAYLPGAGWIGLDPTSGMLAAESHIPLARASVPELTAPVTGSVETCGSAFEFSFSVRRAR